VSSSTKTEAILHDFESGSNIVLLKPCWAAMAPHINKKHKSMTNRMVFDMKSRPALQHGAACEEI
jgi:hypothetical protein